MEINIKLTSDHKIKIMEVVFKNYPHDLIWKTT